MPSTLLKCCCPITCYFYTRDCGGTGFNTGYVVECSQSVHFPAVFKVGFRCLYVDDSEVLTSVPPGYTILTPGDLIPGWIPGDGFGELEFEECLDCLESFSTDNCDECDALDIAMVDGVDRVTGRWKVTNPDPGAGAECPHITPLEGTFNMPWDAASGMFKGGEIKDIGGSVITNVRIEVDFAPSVLPPLCGFNIKIEYYNPDVDNWIDVGTFFLVGNNCVADNQPLQPEASARCSIDTVEGWIQIHRTKHYDFDTETVEDGAPACSDCEEEPP